MWTHCISLMKRLTSMLKLIRFGSLQIKKVGWGIISGAILYQGSPDTHSGRLHRKITASSFLLIMLFLVVCRDVTAPVGYQQPYFCQAPLSWNGYETDSYLYYRCLHIRIKTYMSVLQGDLLFDCLTNSLFVELLFWVC